MTAVMFAVLVALGTWQVHRLQWKSTLLADIARGSAAAAVPLPASPRPFAKVAVAGTLRSGTTGLYGVEVRMLADGPHLGADLLALLDRPGAAPILVDLGWVPTDQPLPVLPTGPVQLEGYVRPAESAVRFGPRDDVAQRRFYALDPRLIGGILGVPNAAPFTLVVLGDASDNVPPLPARALPLPANNHLQYAITWYGFAVTLVVIFVLWTRKALQS